jgi:hypothetical protein
MTDISFENWRFFERRGCEISVRRSYCNFTFNLNFK